MATDNDENNTIQIVKMIVSIQLTCIDFIKIYLLGERLYVAFLLIPIALSVVCLLRLCFVAKRCKM